LKAKVRRQKAKVGFMGEKSLLPSGKLIVTTEKQSRSKCGDSLREVEESAYWLELLVDAGIVGSDKLSSLRQECKELTAIFVTILNRAKDK